MVTNTAACAAGVYSLFEALHFLRRGDANALVVGGTESAILPLAFISMARTGALSKRNDDPQTASRPFDNDRDGFLFGEGAGMLVVETLEHAQKRGARILAELCGGSITGDAYHVSAPEPSGESARRAIVKAIADAELRPDDIDYVCAHGTEHAAQRLRRNARAEAGVGRARVSHSREFRKVDDRAPARRGWRAQRGGRRSRRWRRAACRRRSTSSRPIPSATWTTWRGSRARGDSHALVNGFGFGGQNSVAVFKKWED